MPLLLILLPLVNFLLLTLTSSRVHWRQLIALVLVSKSLVLGWSAANFEKMILGETYITKIGEWFDFGLLNVSWTFSIDPLTHVMLFTVMLVSTLVHTYSTAYMSEDPHLPRFLSYLSLFTFFMLLLISADNLVNLFLGWEGVGLCSYLLISFWFTRIQANKAALKAMIVNRIADLALTLGVLTVFYVFQTTEFNVVFGLAQYVSAETRVLLFGNGLLSISVCSALLFIGAMGKSAQIGLHTWLPDAMEGERNAGPSIIKKIPPYAGTATFTTLIVRPPLQANEKFNIARANPQETSSTTLGSSETLRGTSTNFNFNLFRSSGRYLTTDLEWLIGFSEGDGSFIVNNGGSLYFQITQSATDVQVLYRTRKLLGFGSVRVQDKGKPFPAWTYTVRDRTNLKRLIHLFNGNLVLEKSQLRFSAFVTAFHTKYSEKISLLPELVTPSLTTGWLSGFSDAEGCFTVSVLTRQNTTKSYVQARFILAQKDAEKELRAFATLLSGKLSFQKSYGGYNLAVQKIYLKKTLHYFRRFPLKTKKRISLIKFLAIYRLLTESLEQKRPLSQQELTLIRKRAKEINPDWWVSWKALTSKAVPDKIETVVEDKVRSIK